MQSSDGSKIAADDASHRAVDETGILLREGGAFILKRDLGGTYRLDLRRTPVDLVEKHVRIIGIEIAPEHIDVEGVQPA